MKIHIMHADATRMLCGAGAHSYCREQKEVGFDFLQRANTCRRCVRVFRAREVVAQAGRAVRSAPMTRANQIEALESEGYKFVCLAVNRGTQGSSIEFMSYRKGMDFAVIQTQILLNKESFSIVLKGAR